MNTDGGVLIIGISDNGEIIGLTKDLLTFGNSPTWDTWQQHLTNLIHDRYKISSEFDRYFHVRKTTHDDKSIAIISIEPTDAQVWMFEEGKPVFYIRRKNKTVSLDGLQLATYLGDRFHKNR
jgi:predicted HTH transcriptional regulator